MMRKTLSETSSSWLDSFGVFQSYNALMVCGQRVHPGQLGIDTQSLCIKHAHQVEAAFLVGGAAHVRDLNGPVKKRLEDVLILIETKIVLAPGKGHLVAELDSNR